MRARWLPFLISGLLATPAVVEAQTLPVAGSAASGFAVSIALMGDDVLVARNGAELRLPTYPEAGAVYVYRRSDDAAWAVAETLRPGEGTVGDQFGTGVAWVGERLLIGAPGAEESRGRAYLFERREGNWVERAALDPAAEPRAGVGSAVAMTADAAFLGAPGRLGDLPRFGQPAPAQPGVVYIYTVSPDGALAPAGRLESPSPEGSDRFGAALVAAGDQLIVGAPGSDGGRGAVYRFERDDDAWRPAGAFVLESLAAGAGFGASLALEGNTLFAGAPGQAAGGVVAAFDVSESPGAPGLVRPPEGSGAAAFGASLAVGGGMLWVGAPRTSGATGAAYVFDGTSLDYLQSVDAAPFGPGASFGSSLGAGTEMVVVGAGQADLRLGAAAVLERSGADGAWAPSSTLRDPERPNLTAVTGETVSCEEGTALEYACTDVDLVAFLPLADLGAGPTSIANDIWGWTDPGTGREYVLLGKSNGTSFVDITDPNAPVYVGELPLTEGGVENLWRDIKTYADHAFIVADNAGAHGVQIFDLRQLRDVRDPPVMFEETAVYDGVFSSHNIVINEETGFAHAVGSSGGGEACGGGLHMIDIRDPANPRFAGCFADPAIGGSLGAGYTHDAQCVIYEGPDEEYVGREICFHASISALGISDITDKDNPVALANAGYPGAVAAHQGWLTEDHRYFYLGDELDEEGGTVPNTRTLVWDVAELDDPVLATEYFAETRSIDHNQYVRGDFLYQSNLLGGLRILDISDPENPVEVAFFDTVPTDDDATAFGGTWSNYPYFESGVIAISSWNEGLFLLRKRERVLVP
ncbi:choice-of-anchor B family protein [Candidatus Palauibacter sp.]|uniref:choice-of-anchor B family protein n=1 Tax=Candidatus Palauibacter sp. TaxID=3101350 RepID=UPI003B024EE4